MRTILSCVFLLLLIPLLPAQCDREYDRVITLANESLQARDYQLVINRLLYAQDICPDRKNEVDALIKKAFRQIEQEKETADSALRVATRVLQRIEFFAGKYGRTYENRGTAASPRYSYGFIDRNGKTVIPFAFESASHFYPEDGFARVVKEGTKALLDTSGNVYPLAKSLDALTPEIQALDIHGMRLDSLPVDLSQTYPNVKVLLAYQMEAPSEVLEDLFSRFPNAEWANLSDNLLSALPAWKGTHLRSLQASHNNLTALPEELFTQPDLQRLDVSHNQLRNLDPSIKNLSNLEVLNLSENKLSSLPAGIGQLGTLRHLYLNNNSLESLPAGFGQLSSLKVLHIEEEGRVLPPGPYGNHLSQLPDDFWQLTALEELKLAGNDLAELAPGLGNLINLERLELARNQLRILPAELGNLSQLKKLDLSRNAISQIPTSIGKLENLYILDLGDNEVSDLPLEVQQLSQLRILELNQNQLSFVPEGVLALIKLTTLNLQGNHIAQIPPEFGRLERLRTLKLGHNELTTVEPWLGSLRSLSRLYLNDNQLEEIEVDWGTYRRLRELFLNGNRLSTLSPTLEELGHLRNLDLRHNRFTEFPPFLCEILPRKVSARTFVNEERVSGEFIHSYNPLSELPVCYLEEMTHTQVLNSIEESLQTALEVPAAEQAIYLDLAFHTSQYHRAQHETTRKAERLQQLLKKQLKRLEEAGIAPERLAPLRTLLNP